MFILGALFGADKTVSNRSIESDEEIVFKHAVYISNQYKSISYINEPSHHSTLLHKIIHIPRLEQVQTIKKG